jgi:hypothetical protein
LPAPPATSSRAPATPLTPHPPPLQAFARPASDIFTRACDLVASIVVVPLIGDGGAPPLGALYWALDNPCEFGNVQETLLVRLPAALTGPAAFGA